MNGACCAHYPTHCDLNKGSAYITNNARASKHDLFVVPNWSTISV